MVLSTPAFARDADIISNSDKSSCMGSQAADKNHRSPESGCSSSLGSAPFEITYHPEKKIKLQALIRAQKKAQRFNTSRSELQPLQERSESYDFNVSDLSGTLNGQTLGRRSLKDHAVCEAIGATAEVAEVCVSTNLDAACSLASVHDEKLDHSLILKRGRGRPRVHDPKGKT